jgi:hypothetical protein
MISTIIAIILPIFVIVAVGFFYARRHAPDMAAANKINLDIFIPALIFSVLAGKDFQLAEYQSLALGGFVVVLGSGLIAWPFARLMGYSVKTFAPPMMFTNSGNMGLPLMVFAFGEQALPAAVVLFLVENFLHFSLGNALLEGRIHALALLRMPILQATFAGLAVSLLNIPLYEPLRVAIDLLGQVSIPLMLFALGVRMSGVDLGYWRMGLAGAVLCPLSGVLFALLAAYLLHLDGLLYSQLILFGALPPAVLNYMLAEQFQQEPQKVASIVLLGNLFSLAVLPAVLLLVL